MNKTILTLVMISLSLTAKSQNTSVEKSVSGIQIGLLGIWAHNEAKLSNQIALRTEIGLDSGIWSGDYYDGTGFLMTPVLTVEPKWYYNLNKRERKSRRTDGNNGNFVSLKLTYHPDWFVISNYDNINIINDVSIIPTWGIRRNIGNHFNYETGIGVGYRYVFAKQAGYLENESETAVNLHLRIGYRF
ncbi:hypothetical protein [Flavobacterium algicola]|uniref:hypothetical protein n=1 Tax=Flavobacterium algicola TaxID=556529 RepID=UPI001EFE20CF|nr:hypothetical protein [Flavobacterium algicola]MCG9792937.1 hypothetical protein [Flavobacterium algicola]